MGSIKAGWTAGFLALALYALVLPSVQREGNSSDELLTSGGFWNDEYGLWGAGKPAAPKRTVAHADKAHFSQTLSDDVSQLKLPLAAAPQPTKHVSLKSPSPRHPAHSRKTTHIYKGVDLDQVYQKAFNAAFKAAYGGAYSSALGKAEEKLWMQVQKGRKAGKELDALEEDKEQAGSGKVQTKAVLQEKKSLPLSGEGSERAAMWGPLARHCSAGNCDPLEDQGVNVDAWKGLMFENIHRTVPLPQFDPSEDLDNKRAMAQRTGRYAKYSNADPNDRVRWGGSVENDPLKDPTWERLAKHGVNTGSAYWGKDGDLYRALPLPGFDDTQFDHAKGIGKSPYVQAHEHLQAIRDQDSKLEEAGVVVNRYPAAFPNKGYTSVDGVPDRLVKADSIPQYRAAGVAAQEDPTFWLRDDAASQLNTPQWQETPEGTEVRGAPATELQGDLSKAGVNVDNLPEKLGHLWDSTVPSTGPNHGYFANGILPRGATVAKGPKPFGPKGYQFPDSVV